MGSVHTSIKLQFVMAGIIDWNKLKNCGDERLQFEKFCFHIALYLFGEYGSMAYFYNTPGSEFYLTVNKPFEFEGYAYSVGDIIGWQAKYWRGGKDDNNTPFGKEHRDELLEGFKKSKKYRPEIKLWIVCTPGSIVQAKWDELTAELVKVASDCNFESWNKNIFEGYYLKQGYCMNGVFKYFFGDRFIGQQVLIDLTKDTLSILEKKFDTDLHIPSEFEKTLLCIVDNNIAFRKLGEVIKGAEHLANKEKQEDRQKEDYRGFEKMTPKFKSEYLEDCKCRFNLIDDVCRIYILKTLRSSMKRSERLHNLFQTIVKRESAG